MAKLKQLRPKLQTFKSAKPVAQLNNSWRDGKSSTKRGYGYKWQQYRLRFLQENPLCKFCKEQGKVTEATVVDHIIPHQGDKQLFWEASNHQALCKFCHDSIKQKIEQNQTRWGECKSF
ncbi:MULTISPECIES: HNH endonuclease signature motif containing protein [unclassified Acinetobacter]|uniref:HNH endonuclease signature motif containing protein n=1 Tax=unclassified Acinetobacter TaxID=196816 RepID=UPI0015D1422D|nr:MULTISPECIES: HNH endonuclease signature motif containing protein [unclassified Acinetobacter]